MRKAPRQPETAAKHSAPKPPAAKAERRAAGTPRKRRRSTETPAASGRTRVCTKCGQEKPLSAFPLHKHCRDGRNTQCQECINAYQRAYNRRHPDRARAKYRRFYHRHKDRIAKREEGLDRRAKNDIRHLVRLAVKTGLLTKPDRCAHCGAEPPPHRLHAHHPDYAKPLNVVWLCSYCHGKEHARLRAERTKAERGIRNAEHD